MNIAYAAALTLPFLTACVSIELPGVVSDTARVAKDTYHSVTNRNKAPSPAQAAAPAPAPAKVVAEAGLSVSNTYIGQDSQTPTEVKQLCVSEAATKLFKASGKEVAYTVNENTISAINNAIAASCRITADKAVPTAATENPATGA
jgi:hypothetical protein